MTVPSYRLDTVAVHLIERLEGARASYQGRRADADAAFRRIADEELDRIIAEHDELMDDPAVGPRLRREIHETFLPRYTLLAGDHNELEAAGYHAWRKGDPIARGAATLGALVFALAFTRAVHHPVALVVFGAVMLVPFLPEIRRWYHRRQYTRLLQDVVHDLARIQERFDAYSPAPRNKEARSRVSEPEPERARHAAARTKEPPT